MPADILSPKINGKDSAPKAACDPHGFEFNTELTVFRRGTHTDCNGFVLAMSTGSPACTLY